MIRDLRAVERKAIYGAALLTSYLGARPHWYVPAAQQYKHWSSNDGNEGIDDQFRFGFLRSARWLWPFLGLQGCSTCSEAPANVLKSLNYIIKNQSQREESARAAHKKSPRDLAHLLDANTGLKTLVRTTHAFRSAKRIASKASC